MNRKKVKKAVKKTSVKISEIEKFERIFKQLKLQPQKIQEQGLIMDEQPTWIVSDDNSAFKSFDK